MGLSAAIKINVRGLKEMIALAREAKGLVSFVHVSSGYVQCHLQGEVIQVDFSHHKIFRGNLKQFSFMACCSYCRYCSANM